MGARWVGAESRRSSEHVDARSLRSRCRCRCSARSGWRLADRSVRSLVSWASRSFTRRSRDLDGPPLVRSHRCVRSVLPSRDEVGHRSGSGVGLPLPFPLLALLSLGRPCRPCWLTLSSRHTDGRSSPHSLPLAVPCYLLRMLRDRLTAPLSSLLASGPFPGPGCSQSARQGAAGIMPRMINNHADRQATPRCPTRCSTTRTRRCSSATPRARATSSPRACPRPRATSSDK